jgi:hypothetical protein
MRNGRTLPVVLLGGALTAGLALALSCDTVDLGTPPTGINACRPSQRFFIERIWPEFLAKEYGGKRCTDSSCHDAASRQVLRLPVPTSTATLPLPPDWDLVYTAAAEHMSCTSVATSVLLTRPSSATHTGGQLIQPDGVEAMLIKEWVAAP